MKNESFYNHCFKNSFTNKWGFEDPSLRNLEPHTIESMQLAHFLITTGGKTVP